MNIYNDLMKISSFLKFFNFVIFLYVIDSIPYIHIVYGAGVRTHNLLIVSRLP